MIKTDMAMFANRKTNEEKYSEKVRIENARRERIGAIKAFIVGLFIFIAAGIAGTVTDMPMVTKATEAVEIKETETYLICDIVNYVYNANFLGTTDLYVELPNGDIEVFQITDAPESKCHLATLKANDLNNYDTYEVVAVR